MQDQIEQIHTEYSQKIFEAKTLEELDKIFLELFGKAGKVTLLPKEFSRLPKEELKEVGPLFNRVKNELEQAIRVRREEVREEGYKKLEQESFDLTKETQIKKRTGHLHPITQFENQIANIFSRLGFQQYDAPHIDTDHYNFQSLNIPEVHPARELQDTLYIESQNQGRDKLLLRTHTSNSQLRIMEQYKPPVRFMNIGRCFRYENLDPRHEHTFDQFELVYIDKGLSMGTLQFLSEYFLKGMFGPEIKARLQPKYYPFVEPGAGFYGLCIFCKGKGCKVCGSGWLELGGAGMIHPQVLRNGGVDSSIYTGIAWGVGPGRMSMLKHEIEDVRLFNSSDLRFLEKF